MRISRLMSFLFLAALGLAALTAAANVGAWTEHASGGEGRKLTASSQQDPVRVVLRAGYAIPEYSDTANTVTDRLWLATVDATATSSVRCVELRLAITQLVSGGYGPPPVGLADQSTAKRHVSARGEYAAYAHQRVPLKAEATCRRSSGRTIHASAETTVRINVPTCTGALRVLAGSARVNGRDVAKGVRIARGAIASVPRHGRLVVGATECNGFRVVLPPGVARIGGYSPKARGAAFVSNRVVAIRADAHAGVVRPRNLPVFVRPEGIECAVCALPLPASFGVRAEGARAAVRVYLGAASVVTPVRGVRVRAGQQVFVDCHERPCRISGPVLFQPGESFALVPEHPKPLARTIRGAGRPPLTALAPRHSQAQLITSGRAGRATMIAVVWSRQRRAAPGAVVTDKGLIVWLRRDDFWRRAYARRYSRWVTVLVRSADVTRDGQRDFLVTEWNGGSGFCGPRRVLSRMHNDVRTIFTSRNLCETDLSAREGDLMVNTPVGPCPYGDGSAHCYGGIRHDRMRWDGRRFVLFRSLTICHPASLDARRDCTR